MNGAFRRAANLALGALHDLGDVAQSAYKGRRALGKPRPRGVNASPVHARMRGGVGSRDSASTSARVRAGLKSRFPQSLQTIFSCEQELLEQNKTFAPRRRRSNPASCRAWCRAGNVAMRCRVHRPGQALVKSIITDAWVPTPGGALAEPVCDGRPVRQDLSIGLCGRRSSRCWRIPA